MSNALAESVVDTVGDLFGGSLAIETPDPEPDAPETDDDLALAPAADLTDVFGEEDFEDDLAPIEGLDDLDADELRANVVRLARQVEHEKKLRVQTGAKAWRAEAAQKFPYSQPEGITAESRRDFLRQAQAQDQSARKILAPFIEKAQAREKTIEDRLRTEIRAEFEKSWGKPTIGTGPSASAGSEANDRLQTSRKKRDLFGAAKALMDGGVI